MGIRAAVLSARAAQEQDSGQPEQRRWRSGGGPTGESLSKAAPSGEGAGGDLAKALERLAIFIPAGWIATYGLVQQWISPTTDRVRASIIVATSVAMLAYLMLTFIEDRQENGTPLRSSKVIGTAVLALVGFGLWALAMPGTPLDDGGAKVAAVVAVLSAPALTVVGRLLGVAPKVR